MKLTFVKFRGFRGARDELQVSFAPGATIISGRNGAGKSTLCDAIEYAITGTISKFSETREAGEDVSSYIWWRGNGPDQEDGYVSLGYCTEDGLEGEITRRQSGPVDGLENFVKAAEIQADDIDEALNDLCRISLIRDEKITELSVDISERDRADLLKATIGNIDISDISEKLSAARNLINRQKQNELAHISELKGKWEQLTKQISEIRSESSSGATARQLTSRLQTLLNNRDTGIANLLNLARARGEEIDREIERLRWLSGQLKSWLDHDIVNRMAQLRSSNNSLEKEIQLLKERSSKAEQRLKKAEQGISALRTQHEQMAFFVELAEQGKDLGLQDGKCPLCNSSVKEHDFFGHLSWLISRAGNLAKDLASQLEDRKKAQDEVRGHQENLMHAQGQIATQEGQLNSLNQFENSLVKELDETVPESEGLSLDTLLRVQETSQRKERERDELMRTLAAIRSKERIENLAGLSEQQAQLSRALDAANLRASKIDRAAEAIRDTNDSIRRFALDVFDERLEEIAPIMDEVYKRLRPHSDWNKLEFSIRGDVTRLVRLTAHDPLEKSDINPRFVFSSGQRRAAGLAFLLAMFLSKGWTALETVVLDDPVQHVDDYRALQLVEVLRAMQLSGRQIICMAEDEALAELMVRRMSTNTAGNIRRVHMAYSAGQGIRVAKQSVVAPLPLHVITTEAKAG